MEIVIQIAGSVLILVAFGLAQLGAIDVKSVRYLVLNIVGSAVLAVDAAFGKQWGFLLLEGVWAIVSTAGLVAVLRLLRTSRPTARAIPEHRRHRSSRRSL